MTGQFTGAWLLINSIVILQMIPSIVIVRMIPYIFMVLQYCGYRTTSTSAKYVQQKFHLKVLTFIF